MLNWHKDKWLPMLFKLFKFSYFGFQFRSWVSCPLHVSSCLSLSCNSFVDSGISKRCLRDFFFFFFFIAKSFACCRIPHYTDVSQGKINHTMRMIMICVLLKKKKKKKKKPLYILTERITFVLFWLYSFIFEYLISKTSSIEELISKNVQSILWKKKFDPEMIGVFVFCFCFCFFVFAKPLLFSSKQYKIHILLLFCFVLFFTQSVGVVLKWIKRM